MQNTGNFKHVYIARFEASLKYVILKCGLIKIGQGLLLTGDPHVMVRSRTVKEIQAILCFAIFGENSKWPPFLGRGKFFENCQ